MDDIYPLVRCDAVLFRDGLHCEVIDFVNRDTSSTPEENETVVPNIVLIVIYLINAPDGFSRREVNDVLRPTTFTNTASAPDGDRTTESVGNISQP